MEHVNGSLKQDLLKEYIKVLDFWEQKFPADPAEGFPGEVNNEGIPVKDAIKGIVLNARVLWTFASAYNFLGREKYLDIASRVFNYIVTRFWDNQEGGLYWSLDHEGNLIDGRKQIYAQGFGIYGFVEYYLASGLPESLDRAVELYRLIEKHSRDPLRGGYVEALSKRWGLIDDMRLSDKDMNEPKSMNTHLHLLEPYTSLYRVWPDKQLSNSLRQLIELFNKRIINPETSHLNLFFDMDWNVKSNKVSYGHDIECAWLLREAAEALGDYDLIEATTSRVIGLTNAVITNGLAPDGSVYNEKNLDTGQLHPERDWWVQAEALVGFINAFELTGEPRYLEKMLGVWAFIKTKLVDRRHGEWFLRVDKNGLPVMDDPKAGFWKCPYHNTRALMEAYKRLQKIEQSNNTLPKDKSNISNSLIT